MLLYAVSHNSPLAVRAGKAVGLLLAMIYGLSLHSCGNDDEAAEHFPTLYDVVELASQDDVNGSVFTLYRPDADDPVTLTSSQAAVNLSVVKPGESLFLAYVPHSHEPYTSGEITVVNYGTVNNSTIKKSAPEKLEGWDSEPVFLMSHWRAGNKICMRLKMTYDPNPRLFALVVDESTLGDDYPTAYLFNRRSDDTPGFSRQYYAAFDVSAMWQTVPCKGLKVRVNNSNLPSLDCFTVANPLAGAE